MLLMNEEDLALLEEVVSCTTRGVDAHTQLEHIQDMIELIRRAHADRAPDEKFTLATLGLLIMSQQCALYLDAKGRDWRSKIRAELSAMREDFSRIAAEEEDHDKD